MIELVETPEEAGFSGEGIARAQAILQEAVDAGHLMGGVVQVARRGKALPVIAVGRRELTEGGQAVDADTGVSFVLLTNQADAARVL